MGRTYEVSCQCGYNRELNLGCGLSSYNLNIVNKIFLKDELEQFNNKLKNDEVESFAIESVAALCERCNEIEQIAKLKVKLKDGNSMELLGKCPICNGTVSVLGSKYICPICKNDMDIKAIGFWD